MHRLPSRRLGGNVGVDPSFEERRQERLRKIPFIRAHGLNPKRVCGLKSVE
jgi:hypothetical protein